MTDDEIDGLLARLPVHAPPAATARFRSQSHVVLARLATQTQAASARPARFGSRLVEATAFAAMFLYLAGAVGEALELYQLMP